jgi:hypothetical protein
MKRKPETTKGRRWRWDRQLFTIGGRRRRQEAQQRRLGTPYASDVEAMASDWQAVGDDLRHGIRQVIQEDLMTTTDNHIRAPWTDEQVAALNRWQTSGRVHPFTCRDRGEPGHVERPDADLGQLVATPEGWVCPDCDYTQGWAHRFMLETPPRWPGEAPFGGA